MHNACPFCELPAARILAEDGPCVAVGDLFPVSKGHMLIIPCRHIRSFQEMSPEEWQAVHRLARSLAVRQSKDDPTIIGFNLGINDGEAAGQTVFHAHVHWIPRRAGDVARPRGGVRGIIPGKADYPQTGR
jgi:diadenosine tetraphosphate (Ap4A) HIT family hydrolase